MKRDISITIATQAALANFEKREFVGQIYVQSMAGHSTPEWTATVS